MKFIYLAAAAIAALAAATPASAAATVDYNTTSSTLSCGAFSQAGATCSANLGSQTLTFTGATDGGPLTLAYSAITNAIGMVTPPSTISLGTITFSDTAAGTYNLAGVMLDIAIFSNPPGSSGSIPSGDITGSLSGFSSGAALSWISPSVTIGNLLYSVTTNPLPLAAPGTNGGSTTINGHIDAVPEPATWAMMLIGFGAVGFTMRRRRASNIPQLA